MKERPILFSGPMVRAILDGQKTQTRRVIKPQPNGLWAAPGKTTCPFGQPGDRLWVRETHYVCSNNETIYRVDNPPVPIDIKWKPSTHMPRRTSRINLEITGIRVEKLQDITEENAIAEGLEKAYTGWRDYRSGWVKQHHLSDPVDSFRTLWDSINGRRGYGWGVNPFVWVIKFRMIKA